MTVSPSAKLREAGSQRTTRRRPARRPSASHLLIAVVVILAFLLNLLVLQDRSSTTLVAVARQPLTAGTVLDPDAVRLTPVDSSFEALGSLVTEDDLAQFDGWVVNRSIPEGGLLELAALSEPGVVSGLRSMSLPIPIEHAAGGSLVEGDRVDVITVSDDVARFVATDLQVIAVADSGGPSLGSTVDYHIVVAVTAAEALDLAEALAAGSLEIVRSTGAEEGQAG